MLAWTIYLSFAGAMCCQSAEGKPALARWLALSVAVATRIRDCGLHRRRGTRVTVFVICRGCRPWGFTSLGGDGIAGAVLLTGSPGAGVLFSGTSNCAPMNFSLSSWRSSGSLRSFSQLRSALLFVFYEIAIVPSISSSPSGVPRGASMRP